MQAFGLTDATVLVPRVKLCQGCNRQLIRASNLDCHLCTQTLAKGLAQGEITLPDTVFILNVNDVSFCADPGWEPGKPQVQFDGACTALHYLLQISSVLRDGSCWLSLAWQAEG